MNINSHLSYFLTNKIGYFSQANTKEEANFISRLVAPNGERSSWSLFKKIVLEKFPNYNTETLEKEFINFFAMAQCYQIWKDVQKDKGFAPYLKYSTVMDSVVCNICKKLNNIIRPVDDSFWDTYFPPNCIECRCTVIQCLPEDVKRITDLSKKNFGLPLERFAINVGKTELKLPY